MGMNMRIAVVTNNRRFLLAAVSLALLSAARPSSAMEKASWDGVWTGSLGNASKISVTIANDKVVNYSFRGAPMKIVYAKVAPTKVSFGDPHHYEMTLLKTGDATASAGYNGRRGASTAALTRN
jgi:hypothetical protein